MPLMTGYFLLDGGTLDIENISLFLDVISQCKERLRSRIYFQDYAKLDVTKQLNISVVQRMYILLVFMKPVHGTGFHPPLLLIARGKRLVEGWLHGAQMGCDCGAVIGDGEREIRRRVETVGNCRMFGRGRV